MDKEIILIAAVADNYAIGKNNTIPWKLPKDMKFFAETTTGHTVIMGRKTWESIPLKFKPLPNRRNIVITRTLNTIHGADVFDNLDKAIEASTGKVFIIGGGEVYRQALPLANKLIITEVFISVDGDVFFPEIDAFCFSETSRIINIKDDNNKHNFDIVTYERYVPKIQ